VDAPQVDLTGGADAMPLLTDRPGRAPTMTLPTPLIHAGAPARLPAPEWRLSAKFPQTERHFLYRGVRLIQLGHQSRGS